MANYTCIVCPVSCQLTVEEVGGELKVTGHTCKRGEEFGKNEHTNPMRMLTSTVVLEGSFLNRLPVVSEKEVPKAKLRECLKAVYAAKVQAPVQCGDVVIADVCGTGVNILASRSMPAK